MPASAAAPAATERAVTDEERYLFDLHGYLVVPGALDADDLAELNAEFDRRIAAGDPAAPVLRFYDPPNTPITWGGPFARLIDNPRIMPHLREFIGDQVRLDHEYADIIHPTEHPGGGGLHSGNTPFDECMFYVFRDGKPRSGLTVVAYNLHDVGPDDGGFGCVPGSHKANYPLPPQWADTNRRAACVTAVHAPAGSAIIFTEALTHGTLPWRGRHQRRTLFFKYSPPSISWAAHYYDPAEHPGLTPRQRAMLEGPNARYGHR
jgi:ectoine hydroxylase-related dioxygenase (phytanoyl-CoA dioxygenase family)